MESDGLDRDGPALKLHSFIYLLLNSWVKTKRNPDHVIGVEEDPYLLRWYVTLRKPWLPGIYLHVMLRSDRAFALHDHPWWNISYILKGQYIEVTIDKGGCERRKLRKAGDIVFRRATDAHRIEVASGEPVCSLFIKGPVTRQWGFHCPKAGWTHWKAVMGQRGNEAGEGKCE